MPHNREAEMQVLGAMLMDPAIVVKVVEKIPEEAFYDNRLRLLYKGVSEVFTREFMIDNLLIAENLQSHGVLEEIGGTSFIMEVADSVATSANWETHTDILVEKFLQRRLINIGAEITEKGFDGGDGDIGQRIGESEQLVFDLSRRRNVRDFMSMDKVVTQTFSTISKRVGSDSNCVGIESDYTDLDALTSGAKPSELIILAARPAMGKTAFAMNLALNAAKKGHGVAIFSLEMGIEAIGMRFLSMEAGIDSQKLQKGNISNEEASVLAFKSSQMAQLPIFIDDTALVGVPQIAGKLRRLKAEHPIDLVIIDYLQLMKASDRTGEGRQQEVSEISRGLKLVARELDIPLLVLSQLSRAVEQRTDKRPMLSDLRESGAIEQDADQVLFLYREEYYKKENTDPRLKGVTEVVVSKNRMGPTGKAYLFFDGRHTKFHSVELGRADELNQITGTGEDY
jgi:replicative DNA helicase